MSGTADEKKSVAYKYVMEDDLDPTFYQHVQPTNSQHRLSHAHRHIFSSITAYKILDLCEGAPVVATQNMTGVPNGSRGTVTGFSPISIEDLKVEMDSQHGSYGVTAEHIDKYFRKINLSPDMLWPVVEFSVGGTSVIRTVFPAFHNVTEADEGQVLCWRLQLPVTLAWACTIHRSQGMTLDKVVLDVVAFKSFGQLYVALSRVRLFRNLKIVGNLSQKCVLANPTAVNFDSTMPWRYIDNGPPQAAAAAAGGGGG